MRVFGFGSSYGFIVSVFLARYRYTVNHRDYSSDYLFQLFGLIGAIIAWAFLPAMAMAGMFHAQMPIHTDYKYLGGAIMKMWLALMASAVGSVCGSLALHKKLSIHDITFSLLSVHPLLLREESSAARSSTSLTPSLSLWQSGSPWRFCLPLGPASSKNG